MFSTKTGAVVIAAASVISTSQDLEALSIKGDIALGLRLIPDLERTHPSVWRSCVVTIRGVPCISLGNGAFVTAGHVGCPRGATGHYRVRAKDGTPCDLVLFRHAEGPHGVEPLAIAPQLERAKGEVVVLATSKAHPNVVIGNASQNHHTHLFLYEKKPFQFMIFKNFFGSAEILFRDTNMLGSGGAPKNRASKNLVQKRQRQSYKAGSALGSTESRSWRNTGFEQEYRESDQAIVITDQDVGNWFKNQQAGAGCIEPGQAP